MDLQKSGPIVSTFYESTRPVTSDRNEFHPRRKAIILASKATKISPDRLVAIGAAWMVYPIDRWIKGEGRTTQG